MTKKPSLNKLGYALSAFTLALSSVAFFPAAVSPTFAQPGAEPTDIATITTEAGLRSFLQASEGTTLRLQNDIVLTGNITSNANGSVLDLNGFSISLPYNVQFVNAGDLTIKNGTIIYTEKTDQDEGVAVTEVIKNTGSSLALEDITISAGTINVVNSSNANATVTIQGESVISSNNADGLFVNTGENHKLNVTLEGGSFTGKLIAKDTTEATGDTLSIEGGEYSIETAALSTGFATQTISGGKFVGRTAAPATIAAGSQAYRFAEEVEEGETQTYTYVVDDETEIDGAGLYVKSGSTTALSDFYTITPATVDGVENEVAQKADSKFQKKNGNDWTNPINIEDDSITLVDGDVVLTDEVVAGTYRVDLVASVAGESTAAADNYVEFTVYEVEDNLADIVKKAGTYDLTAELAGKNVTYEIVATSDEDVVSIVEAVQPDPEHPTLLNTQYKVEQAGQAELTIQYYADGEIVEGSVGKVNILAYDASTTEAEATGNIDTSATVTIAGMDSYWDASLSDEAAEIFEIAEQDHEAQTLTLSIKTPYYSAVALNDAILLKSGDTVISTRDLAVNVYDIDTDYTLAVGETANLNSLYNENADHETIDALPDTITTSAAPNAEASFDKNSGIITGLKAGDATLTWTLESGDDVTTTIHVYGEKVNEDQAVYLNFDTTKYTDADTGLAANTFLSNTASGALYTKDESGELTPADISKFAVETPGVFTETFYEVIDGAETGNSVNVTYNVYGLDIADVYTAVGVATEPITIADALSIDITVSVPTDLTYTKDGDKYTFTASEAGDYTIAISDKVYTSAEAYATKNYTLGVHVGEASLTVEDEEGDEVSETVLFATDDADKGVIRKVEGGFTTDHALATTTVLFADPEVVTGGGITAVYDLQEETWFVHADSTVEAGTYENGLVAMLFDGVGNLIKEVRSDIHIVDENATAETSFMDYDFGGVGAASGATITDLAGHEIGTPEFTLPLDIIDTQDNNYVIFYTGEPVAAATEYQFVLNGAYTADHAIVTVTATVTPDEAIFAEGVYTIGSALGDDMVLDIAGASTTKANVQLYKDNGTSAQKFAIHYAGDGFYTIENLKSGLFLDVAGASTDKGANVQQYKGNGTDAQLWRIESDNNGNVHFVSKLGTVLDVKGGGTTNGTNIQTYEANGTAAQTFTLKPVAEFEKVADSDYVFTSAIDPSFALDVAGNSDKSGANVRLYKGNDTAAQLFTVKANGDGFYTIYTNEAEDLVLDVAGGKDTNGTNVQQYKANGTIAQQWMIVSNEDGTYTFVSRCNGLVLDIAGAKAANGTNAQLYKSNGTNAQKFNLVAVQAV